VSVPPGSPAPSIEQLTGPPPHAAVEKPFLLSDGRVELEASLDKAVYSHGEPILVNTAVHNNSGKTVRRIKVSSQFTELKINFKIHNRNVRGGHRVTQALALFACYKHHTVFRNYFPSCFVKYFQI
jgi:hypothetical protein